MLTHIFHYPIDQNATRRLPHASEWTPNTDFTTVAQNKPTIQVEAYTETIVLKWSYEAPLPFFEECFCKLYLSFCLVHVFSLTSHGFAVDCFVHLQPRDHQRKFQFRTFILHNLSPVLNINKVHDIHTYASITFYNCNIYWSANHSPFNCTENMISEALMSK